MSFKENISMNTDNIVEILRIPSPYFHDIHGHVKLGVYLIY